MSSTPECSSGNLDRNKRPELQQPETSTSSISSNSKKTANNQNEKKTTSQTTPKKSPKRSVNDKQRQPTQKQSLSSSAPNPTDVTTAMQKLHLRTVNDYSNEEDVSRSPNSKSGKKNEKLKQIQIPQNSANWNSVESSQPYVLTSVQEFVNQMSQMYANTNTRYLENVKHHPQYQYMSNPAYTYQNTQYSASVPNTPLMSNGMNVPQMVNQNLYQMASGSNTLHNTSYQNSKQMVSGSNTLHNTSYPNLQQMASGSNTLQNTSYPNLQQLASGSNTLQNTSYQNSQQMTSGSNTLHNTSYPNLQKMASGSNTLHSTSYPNSQQMSSVPNSPQMVNGLTSPMMQPLHRPRSASIPNSPNSPNMYQMPQGSYNPNPSRFVQNMMQHPLLNQMYQPYNTANNVQNDKRNNGKNNSPSHKKKNNRKDNKTLTIEEKQFDPYMTEEEVNKGLQDNTLLEGILRINPKQFQHAYISSTLDRSEQDILIDGIKNRNRALEGDVVVVQLIETDVKEETPEQNEKKKDGEEDKQRKGKIVFIKEKVHNRTCIGNLKLMADNNRQKALFVPRDHRIPRLNIPFTCWPDNFYMDAKKYENTIFLAKIVEWTDTRFAAGIIVCNVGVCGDMVAESKAILLQNDLDVTPYGAEFKHLYPRPDYIIPEEEIKLREDCRNLCIFSIDPSNCRDIDDAISCVELQNGNYEIGVHISDVSHYLAENTNLDERVADKATTIYMVERAYHMLPDELCMLCSLFPGVDKLAFSVFWEMTKDAEVISHRFTKTVIRSCCQLAYDQAQAILEDSDDAEKKFPETYNGYKYNEIYKSIKIFGELAAKLRKQRFDTGALRIDQPKLSFQLDTSNGFPNTFSIYEIKESNQMIEEFMLLANMTVAKRIYEDYPELAFLRSHPPPSGYMMRQLASSLLVKGIELDITSAGSLHRSLLVHADGSDIGKTMVLNMLCAKPMSRAKYFCAYKCDDDDFLHYALNVPLYTHFTSPIRRYADIMVHRLLSASLKYREKPEWKVNTVSKIAAQCNKQKYNAKKAGEMSTELYTFKYIEMHSPIKADAVVVDIKEKYIDVIVVAMNLTRRIFFNPDFPGECKFIKNIGGTKLSMMEVIWNEDEANHLPKVKQIIEVFSVLQVQLQKGEIVFKIETKLLRPE